jgi:hypothetical protein
VIFIQIRTILSNTHRYLHCNTMSIFKQMVSTDGKRTIVNVCVEDEKKFIAHAFMILTTDLAGNKHIVTPINQRNEPTFFTKTIQPRDDCKTMEKLAILRLRESSRNLFCLDGISLGTYIDVPMPHYSGMMCRIYFLSIPCVQLSVFDKNKKIIDSASEHFKIPSEWTKTQTLTLLPLNLINFDMLDTCPYLMDVNGKKLVVRSLDRLFLTCSKDMITIVTKFKMMMPLSLRIHASKSWTNGTTCYYHKV